ncbi:MAG: hypothetical protein IJ072_07115 [Oscillospiraceae bacterium]|nr:hypothetical protein [Oscillospiraceae bacterium]
MKTGRKTEAGLAVLLLALIITVTFAACAKANISAYKDREILVTGLTENDFTITPGELMELPCVSDTAVGQSEKAGTVRAYGPTLETFLQQYGYRVSDIKSIRFTAGDNYKVTLGKITWDQYSVIFSVANGSKPLYESEQPLRIVIPGGNSGNWIRNVERIEFTLNQ